MLLTEEEKLDRLKKNIKSNDLSEDAINASFNKMMYGDEFAFKEVDDRYKPHNHVSKIIKVNKENKVVTKMIRFR